MGRVRLVASLVGAAALVALLTPASALAGTYSWSQPGDFTTAAPGANPEQKYGQPSWAYLGSGGSPMTTFSSSTWSDASGDSIGPSAGKLTITAAAGKTSTLSWTNPFTSNQSVTVTSTGWTGSGLGCILGSVSVPSGTKTLTPGQTLSASVSAGILGPCAATGTISISASVAAPAVSVTSPSSGASVSDFQQSFAGSASSGFGISSQVKVRVYAGSSASGTPLETLSSTQSGGSWSVSSDSVLPNGTYTVQAEQDDLAGDQGLSSPVTFTVAHSPSVGVTSPTSGQTVTALQPTFAGTASTGFGIADQVTVRLYGGSSASGTPLETLSTTETGGSWSVPANSALPAGQYTIQAEQDDLAGDQGLSTPVNFSIAHSGPAVSVTSPAAGATLTGVQQTFAGEATSGFGISSQVTLRVYGGSSVGGAPVQTLTATASGGAYSVASTSVLPNGTYTVQAEQDDVVGDQGFSAPITFTVAIPPPTVSLDPLGSAPIQVATPTVSGTGGTRSVDAGQVTLEVYSGTDTSVPALRSVTASVGSDGQFSVQVHPALPDGQYTAVATQDSNVGSGSSHSVVFRVKVNPPALTLSGPGSGATVNTKRPVFSGRAGNALGDSQTVTVYLYHGKSAAGSSAGSAQVLASGSNWSAEWPHTLSYGSYTVVAVQSDDAGHVSRTAPVTFTVAPTPKLIGSSATLSRSGRASVPIGCLAGPGQSCSGTVLIVTRHSYRTTAAGPIGRLEVLFAKVRISGGRSVVIHGSVGASVLRVLLRHRAVPVIVTVNLSRPAGDPLNASARRVLELRH